MKKISVKNFKGEEFEGMWNEKTYSSKIDGRPDGNDKHNHQCK